MHTSALPLIRDLGSIRRVRSHPCVAVAGMRHEPVAGCRGRSDQSVPSHPHPNPGCCRDLLSSHCNNGRNWISFRSDSPAFPKLSHSRFDQTKFSSWSLILASFGRCFHAISARLMPIVQRKCITKLVSHFQNSINCYYLHINILLEFYFVPRHCL